MPSYKLLYFDARARGEPIRMILALAGQQYEDVRISEEDWAKVKEDRKRFPFAAMPVLEIDGRPFCQSKSIGRYLAREFVVVCGMFNHSSFLPGFYGSNDLEAYEIDVCVDISTDIEEFITPSFEETDQSKIPGPLIKGRDTKLKPTFEYLSNSIEKAGGKYIVGNQITYADVITWNILDFFLQGRFAIPGYFDPYPVLQKYYDGIRTDSPLTDFLNKRPPVYL